MKLRMFCSKCIEENIKMGVNPVNVEMSDNGIYKFECSEGHKNVVFLQKTKFEILFDSGAMAMIDGYQREAVSSFAAALERFYEFCIEVFLTNKKVDSEQYLETWKLVANQSERQLGAYFFLYLSEFGEIPKEFNKKQTEFRNKVIHKGYIPKNDEVIKYAEHVYDYIMDIGALMEEKYSSTIIGVCFNQQGRARRLAESENIKYNEIAVLNIPTIIDGKHFKNVYGKRALKDALNSLKFHSTNSNNPYFKE